jgi:hypothetical protein
MTVKKCLSARASDAEHKMKNIFKKFLIFEKKFGGF